MGTASCRGGLYNPAFTKSRLSKTKSLAPIFRNECYLRGVDYFGAHYYNRCLLEPQGNQT